MMGIHNVEAGGAAIPSLGFGTWAARAEECAQAVSNKAGTRKRFIDEPPERCLRCDLSSLGRFSAR